MSAKYYTQFILTDADYRGGNEFCGVVELNQPMSQDSDRRDIEAILARNFDLSPDGAQYAAYSELRWQATAKLVVDLGMRWDQQTYTTSDDDRQYSPRASLLWRTGDRTEIRMGFGQFYQAVGCDQCMETGYRGRMALFEILGFSQQVRDYLQGDSPYLRGTLGMVNMASELLSRDPRTKPVVVYQMTWSAGGDALVQARAAAEGHPQAAEGIDGVAAAYVQAFMLAGVVQRRQSSARASRGPRTVPATRTAPHSSTGTRNRSFLLMGHSSLPGYATARRMIRSSGRWRITRLPATSTRRDRGQSQRAPTAWWGLF